MHILFLTDNFPPEVNAPASRTFEHCREWVKAGHQVTVVTCAPNFPKGAVYDGYRNRLWQSEQMDGIRVVRVWSYVTANEGFLKRTLDYISYMVSAVIAAPFVRRADLVVATSPQFFTACAGYVVSRMKRIPFVFELRDLWPESIKAVGAMKNERLFAMLERIEMFLYRKAACIIPNTHSFKENLTQRGIEPHKIHVITNGVDLTRFRKIPKDWDLVAQYGLEDKFVAGYIGTHGMAHGLDTLLEAAQKLSQMPDGQKYHLLFLGDGARKKQLIDKASALQLSNVNFINSVPKEDVVRYWSLLDVSINHLRKSELFLSVIPSKLFEAMAIGIPVLHGVAGESAQIVEREKVGYVFESEDADALVYGLERLAGNEELYAKLCAASLEAARRYDRKVLAIRMLTQLESVIAKPTSEEARQTKIPNQ